MQGNGFQLSEKKARIFGYRQDNGPVFVRFFYRTKRRMGGSGGPDEFFGNVLNRVNGMFGS